MSSSSNFRIALVAMSLTIGVYSLASILAEIPSSGRPAFPSDPARITSLTAEEAPNWSNAISPFRSDLEGNQALTIALQTIQSRGEKSGQSEENVRAQAAVKQALSIIPYNSELWLALALLQARRDPRAPVLIEALKLSYFVAPNDPQLMPVRLDTATLFDALSDPDLKELVLGDLRLMLTRKKDLKTAVVLAYRRASSLGKKFLEESVQSIDLESMHRPKRMADFGWRVLAPGPLRLQPRRSH
jgi:hypothetical protein